MPAAIIAGGQIIGGLLGGSSAARAARAQADAQIRAAQIAAEEARFRPVGITTRFGQSNFQYGPEGRVTGAGYELAPEFQAYQNRLLGLAGQGLTQAEMAPGLLAPLAAATPRLFGLAERYLAETPEQVAQKYMLSQQDILAPSRERQLANIRNQAYQTGRSGLSVGATGLRPGGGVGLSATNPELEAYYNAIAQQDAALAAGAQEAGQRQLAFGTGLFGTAGQLYDLYGRGQVGALAPYQAYLGGAQGLEALGQQPLELGSALGGRIANPTGANALYGGGMGAAQSMYGANAYNPFATALASFTSNPAAVRAAQGGMLNARYGAENVYGPYGRGVVPTSVTSDDYAFY